MTATDAERADARMVRCPYCDTLKLPETEHECRRAA